MTYKFKFCFCKALWDFYHGVPFISVRAVPQQDEQVQTQGKKKFQAASGDTYERVRQYVNTQDYMFIWAGLRDTASAQTVRNFLP